MYGQVKGCGEHKIRTVVRYLGHQPLGDGWTCGYRTLHWLPILTQKESSTDLGSLDIKSNAPPPPQNHWERVRSGFGEVR